MSNDGGPQHSAGATVRGLHRCTGSRCRLQITGGPSRSGELNCITAYQADSQTGPPKEIVRLSLS